MIDRVRERDEQTGAETGREVVVERLVMPDGRVVVRVHVPERISELSDHMTDVEWSEAAARRSRRP